MVKKEIRTIDVKETAKTVEISKIFVNDIFKIVFLSIQPIR